MWNSILAVFLMAHVLAGIIAAFIAFPLAALSAKGTALHRWSGLTFVGCFFFICVGGYLLEFENLTGTVVDVFGLELNVSPYREDGGVDVLAVINTTMVNTMAFYLAVSGWRVWARARAADRGVFPKFDSIIAVLEIVAGLLFAVTLWYAVDRSDSQGLSGELSGTLEFGHLIIIAATAYVMIDAGHDLYIGVSRRPPRAWWIIHARKMITAEMGLAAAFPYRCVPFGTTGGILMLVAMTIVLVFGIAIARRFAKRIESTPAVV